MARRPTQDESALWRQVTRDVARIDRSGRECVPEDPPAEEPRPVAKKPAGRTAGASEATSRQKPAPPPLKPDRAPGLDLRTRQRLKRGQLPIEARLDLHGMTQAAAHAALNSFIAGQRNAGRRVVLVITGKGGRSAESPVGVLRRQVPMWINQPPLREMVLGLSPAAPRDGGDGALYLLLRRAK